MDRREAALAHPVAASAVQVRHLRRLQRQMI
jgi:hypothetical protein